MKEGLSWLTLDRRLCTALSDRRKTKGIPEGVREFEGWNRSRQTRPPGWVGFYRIHIQMTIALPKGLPLAACSATSPVWN